MKDRAYKIAINPNYDGYQRTIASIIYRFFGKKTGWETKANVYKVMAQELHKLVIKKFKKRKLYARFKDNIRAADLVFKQVYYLLKIEMLNVYYVSQIFSPNMH